ncbi:MAG TPA: apolipoprotein N-acyltransferase [Actinomycetota bacterium]|nr:apolipoprotein N-acyltransferase [Actinomycetota bacterium]
MAAYLAFPPVEAWPLAFLAPVPLLISLRGAGPARGALLGAAYGVVGFGLGLSWIHLFGTLAWSAIVVLTASSTALFGALAPVVRLPGRPFVSAAGIAALWTAIDWARGLWPLGGFTWGSLGVSQVSNTVTARLAVVAGVWGVTFVVVLAAALLAEALRSGTATRRRAAVVTAAAAVALLPIAIPFQMADGRPLDVAALQVDFRRGERLSSGAGDITVTRLNLDLHERLRSDPPDLAIWGESSMDPESLERLDEVRAGIADVGAPVLLGSTSRNVRDPSSGPLYNQAALFDGRGAVLGTYRKTHLVPYGEYIPWKPVVGWISALEQIGYELAPGERLHTLTAPRIPAFGTPICFENSFPALDRELVAQGAEFLVVLTNNASYGRSAASAQQLQMSRMRAIETGRWVVHAAVSGISGFIDPTGRVWQETELFRPTIIRRTIVASTAATPFVRVGDWLPVVSLVGVGALLLVPRNARRRRPDPEALGADVRTLVILPTYDEARTIREVVAGVLTHPGVDALVVDDSSPDGTAAIVRSIGASDPRVRLIERPAKSGLASAYLEGFTVGLAEGYDLIVEMDSDLSHDPTELPALLRAARDRHHLVVGSRYVPGGSVTNWSRVRVALSKAGNRYARLMLGLPLHDATSGYRVYRRALLERLVAEPFHSDGYGFQVELVMRAWLDGWSLGEAPITFREREHGHSKISRRIVFEALWLVTKWGVSLRMTGRPHRRERTARAGEGAPRR